MNIDNRDFHDYGLLLLVLYPTMLFLGALVRELVDGGKSGKGTGKDQEVTIDDELEEIEL